MPKPPKVFGLPVPGTETPDSTPIYRHVDFVNGPLLDSDETVKTVWDMVTTAVKKYGKYKCHGRRVVKDGKAGDFVWQSFSQVFTRVTHFASGLKPYLKMDATDSFKIAGLMGMNSSEWTIGDWATIGMGATTVPLYTTTPKDILEYSLNQNGCSVVICDFPCATMLLKAKPGIPSLSTLIVYGPKDTSGLKKQAEELGVALLTFAEVEAAGKQNPQPFEPPNEKSVFSFIYTSGSTGMPKGALLTHEAQVSQSIGALYNIDSNGLGLRPGKEFHLSYLPSAHVMERCFQLCISFSGGATGFFQGKREELTDDIKTLRPTYFVSVPRLLNMIYDKVMNTVRAAGGAKAKLFQTGLNAKIKKLKSGTINSAFWDTLVFNGLKKRLGLDRVKAILTGSAPISGAVLDFYRVAIGTCVVEGYGATETCAGGTQTHPYQLASEHVGSPTANLELKLVSIPEMNYLATDTALANGSPCKGRGEICIRGKAVMREYYRAPEATAKALDKDGWYHSGDVGAVLPDGTFKVFDRIGNVFKLSIGEYVAPEKIENICTRSNFVTSIFVHGDTLHSKLVAIIVPDAEVALAWAKENNLKETDIKVLAKEDSFIKAVLADIDKTCKSSGLQSYEVPKAIYLDPEQFSIDTVLTATLKMQRKRALLYYDVQLKALLASVD